jgi:hypothetical protein
MTTQPIILSRYTEFPSLLYLVQTKSITLLDPRYWDDGNDSYFMSLYKERKKLSSLLALCFTAASETYHHWRVFAPGSSGVRIEFLASRLSNSFSGRGMRTGAVRYLTIPKNNQERFLVKDLPFLKRYPYKPENEYRVIYQSTSRDVHSWDVPIDIEDIHRIVLSPWLHPNLTKHVRNVLRSVDGCRRLHVHRSTLVGNDEWKAMGDKALSRPCRRLD